MNQISTNNQSSMDDMTDNEWTFSSPKKEDDKITEDRPSIKQIYKLVEKADELVRESPIKCRPLNETPVSKITRVKQWLNMDKPDDSCDASCEDDEKESESSEELNESIATCRANMGNDTLNSSCVDLGEDTSTPKVLFRPGRVNVKRNNRPWSVSCISQLSHSTSDMNADVHLSISESALNKLSLLPKTLQKQINQSTNSTGALCHSTSSTVEESTAVVLEEKGCVVKRRKLKYRKKVRTHTVIFLYLICCIA